MKNLRSRIFNLLLVVFLVLLFGACASSEKQYSYREFWYPSEDVTITVGNESYDCWRYSWYKSSSRFSLYSPRYYLKSNLKQIVFEGDNIVMIINKRFPNAKDTLNQFQIDNTKEAD